MVEREVELGPEEGERGAQLMPGVGHEAPLAFERLLEPSQHLVQGVTEPFELVSRAWDGKPFARPLSGDLGRPPSHRIDCSETGSREQVARARREQQRDRAGDQERVAEVLQRFGAVLAGRPDDEHEPLPVPCHGDREQARGLVQAWHRRAVGEGRSPRAGRELARREKRGAAERRRRVEDASAAVEELREGLAPLDQAAFSGGGKGPVRVLHESLYVVGAQAQVVLQGAREVVAQPQVEERSGRGEHDRQREREGAGDTQPDRQLGHGLWSSRRT